MGLLTVPPYVCGQTTWSAMRRPLCKRNTCFAELHELLLAYYGACEETHLTALACLSLLSLGFRFSSFFPRRRRCDVQFFDAALRGFFLAGAISSYRRTCGEPGFYVCPWCIVIVHRVGRGQVRPILWCPGHVGLDTLRQPTHVCCFGLVCCLFCFCFFWGFFL